MSEDAIDCLDLPHLEGLLATYEGRHDQTNAGRVRAAIGRRGSVQTDELYRSGKLFAHELPRDNTGRVATMFVGDPSVWMEQFQHHGIRGKFNVQLATEAARAAERAQRESGGA